MTPNVVLQQIEDAFSKGQVSDGLDLASEYFRETKQFAELFEIEKCRIRHDLGLPIRFAKSNELLDDATQRQLEDRMLDLCREVGELLVKKGDVSEGGLYLQPLMDVKFCESLFRRTKFASDNTDQVIDAALGYGLAPKFGFELLLKHQGTCNGITFFDSQHVKNEEVRRQLAESLVDHVYEELKTNVLYAINEKADKQTHSDMKLDKLIADNEWLYEDGGHHLDISHLASTVRIAQNCRSPEVLEKAKQIASYGCRLDNELVISGNPPFEDLFEAHRTLFEALCDSNSHENAVRYFTEIANSSPQQECKAFLVELLRRIGRTNMAIRQATEHNRHSGQKIDLLEIAATTADYEFVASESKSNNDVLTYCLSQFGQYKETQ